ncbi:MAG: T9SS C-terminal target domain-containing protein [Calditrichaeota bacterium]|nr:MAG: T9SS C-terminal target domain-containing protein [Calditrichota bacterium]
MKKLFMIATAMCLTLNVAQAQNAEIKLKASDSESGNLFGASVAFSGDYLLIGAPGAKNGTGAAYIFRHTGTGWMQEAKLTASDGSNQERYNDFGWAVALDGDLAVIGAAKKYFITNIPPEVGAAYVFKRTASGWIEQKKLTAPTEVAGEFFGYAVSLSGTKMLIGAAGVGGGQLSKGAAYLFEFKNNDWMMTAKLTASDAAEGQFLGSSVWLSDGLALVGAPSCCFTGGAVYVFKNNNGVWQEQAKFKPSDDSGGNLFGSAISGSNDIFLIGSEGWGQLTGKAYVFQSTANGIEQVTAFSLNYPAGKSGNRLGQSVALWGDYALIGASHWGPNANEPGEAFLLQRTQSGWEQKQKLSASDKFDGNNFGWSAALTDQYVIIGAPANQPFLDEDGAVYIYDLSSIAVGVQEPTSALPETFNLEQNYPNPFNPSTMIRYHLPIAGVVELAIYNSMGQHIRTLVKEKQAPGTYEFTWDGADDLGHPVGSGVYLYRLHAGDFVHTRKMILMR